MSDNEMRFPGTFPLPEWAKDGQGADGWEWRMVWLLRKMAGDEAIYAMKTTNPSERQFRQFRERLLDRTAARIAAELPEPTFPDAPVDAPPSRPLDGPAMPTGGRSPRYSTGADAPTRPSIVGKYCGFDGKEGQQRMRVTFRVSQDAWVALNAPTGSTFTIRLAKLYEAHPASPVSADAPTPEE